MSQTSTNEFAGIMTGADGDVADVAYDVIQPVRDDDALGQRAKIMVIDMDAFLRVQLPCTIEVADQLFFLTSILMTGLPAS